MWRSPFPETCPANRRLGNDKHSHKDHHNLRSSNKKKKQKQKQKKNKKQKQKYKSYNSSSTPTTKSMPVALQVLAEACPVCSSQDDVQIVEGDDIEPCLLYQPRPWVCGAGKGSKVRSYAASNAHQSINQPTNEPINQSVSQSINQCINASSNQ